MSQLYKKPPITEAVIVITVRQPLSEDVLDRIHKRLLDEYPAPIQRTQSTPFEIEVSETGPKLKASASTPGYKLTAADGAGVVMLSPNQIGTSRLAPYEGWEPFAARAKENWEAWKRLAGWREIARIGVRFINRLDIPLESEGQAIQLEQYLTVHPRMPAAADLPPMNQFAVNVEAPLGKDNCKLILNVGSVPSALVKTASFLLDIDVVADAGVPQNDEGLWSLIDRIRGYKNAVFEACITDNSRALFSS
jgi:uncharacterized protein (TIGR04255 family)